MRKILVIEDFGDEQSIALKRAAQMYGSEQFEIHVLTFVYDSIVDSDILSEVESDSIRMRLAEDAKEQLSRDVQAFSDCPATFVTEVVWSKNISDYVLELCKKGNFERVIKRANVGGRKRFKATDVNLIKSSPAPVLLAIEDQWPPRPVVLASVDVSKDDERHLSIAREVINAASDAAARLDASLHVVYSFPVSKVLLELDIITENEYMVKAQRQYLPRLRSLIAAEEKPPEFHLVHGQPEREIARLADKLKADLIVLASHTKTGFLRHKMGSTAEALLENLHCDALTMRPGD